MHDTKQYFFKETHIIRIYLIQNERFWSEDIKNVLKFKPNVKK